MKYTQIGKYPMQLWTSADLAGHETAHVTCSLCSPFLADALMPQEEKY